VAPAARAQQFGLFPPRCPDCPVRYLCGESDTQTACRDPAEYRQGALHPDRVQFALDDERRYEFPEPPTSWATSLDLPLVLPIAASGSQDVPPWCAVDAEAALALGKFTTIACLVTSDVVLERIWRARNRLGPKLRAAGVRLVIAPSFSTWWSDPPFEGLHEIARTAEVAARLARSIDTIPTIAWRTTRDIARWADWFSACPPAGIAVDLSTLRSQTEWAWGLQGIRELAARLGSLHSTPRLVAVGPQASQRLRDVRIAWSGDLTIASKGAWQLSQAGRIKYSSGLREETLQLDRMDLLAANVLAMEQVLLATHPLRDIA
jgi:hypothetical protein